MKVGSKGLIVTNGAQLPVEPINEEYVLWGSLPNVDQLSEDDGDDIQIGEDFSGKSQYHEELEGGKESSDEELGGEENTHEEELEYGQNEPTVHEEMEYSGTDSDVSVGDYGGTVLHYDPELPIMEVGSQFPNVEEFRNSLRQHCILHEFGVKFIKNDKFRVTAKCQGVDCPWRIHASVIQDNVTFEVKTLMSDHSCTSVNKVGNEMATSSWLATKLVPILHRTPEMGASKMKMELQQKYHLTLPYGRVLAARGKAVELIYGKASDSFRLVPELQQQIPTFVNTNNSTEAETHTEAPMRTSVNLSDPIWEVEEAGH
ncbi:hypothetical protein QJS10_CPB13g00959 [Acorus calamus]|uniref:Transposase MuDR plant domain-containing protein n=1 Tax=Acorus calamus TaxID=4465 RepID=A0AAV9DES4_ACOCL|nr:hypothetical protein QJS10_CPB13g00959 [Acorus calamus]